MADESSKSKCTPKSMTDEERLKLAEKLDAELDEFIDSLEKRRYTEGWPEENWQEEFEKHPFFMTQTPGVDGEVSPLLEGLQKLKYDPEENTPEELAQTYKDDGNFNFKYKKYRMAIISYTEGLKAKCNNPEINATLYNNRAASHFFLKNYRSALKDCETAIKLKPDYKKAIIRAALCLYHLSEYDKCIERCDDVLINEPENKEVLELRKKAVTSKKQQDRDARKREMLEKKQQLEKEALLSEIEKRGIRIESVKGTKVLDLAHLEPTFPEIAQHRVFIDQDNCLVWPVVFLYPEYKTMDFIQQFKETSTFKEHLEEIFYSPPDWDEQKKYKLEQLNLYFENRNKRKMIKINLDTTLGNALKHEEYIVRGGVPSFMIFVRNSAAEKKYLEDL